MKLRTAFPIVAATGAAVLALVLPGGAGAIVAGAGYTTFVADGQCLHGSVTNCNSYASKDGVYMSGGPVNAALTTGSYFFEVIAPGTQGAAWDSTQSGLLSSDDVTHRTFLVGSDGQVDTAGYTGGHATGTNTNGKNVIGLAPFADTPNPGHVYILAICATGATSSSQCKFDAFKAPPDTPCEGDDCGSVDPFGVTNGMKYYDANTNGQLDPGEVGIANWPIDYHDIVSDTVLTDSDGAFSLTLLADTYTFTERAGGGTWMQTGNTVDQSSGNGGATVTLNADKTYTVVSPDSSTADGLNFGNVCVGGGGGLTLGFWSNKNGQALESSADLTFLGGLNLRNANGTDFNPASTKALASWLLSASATNMAYMLSAQLTAMELNVRHNKVLAGALIYAPGTTSANANGFATVQAVMDEANGSLGTNGVTVASGPVRALQEALKTALDKANNNLNFVQTGPANCPAPPAP